MGQDDYKHIFRAYDIRGVYGKDLTLKVAIDIGSAACHYYKAQFGKKTPVINVGFDVRNSSHPLVHALIAGITSQGGKVLFTGERLAFGQVLFSGWKMGVDFTVFVTASHLTSEWNGMKFYYGDGVGFSEEDNIAVRDIFLEKSWMKPYSPDAWKNIGSVEVVNYKEEYVQFLKNKLMIKKPLKVVIDCGNASGCIVAPDLFKELNYDVVELYCDVDPSFPNRNPEPDEKSLQVLANKVVEEKAAFGVGFDGDADRAVIVDDQGAVLPADTTGILLGQYMLSKRGKKTVLANIECSFALEKVLGSLAKEIKRIKVGHTFLTLEARETPDVIMGVESSGHMVFPEVFLFDDAMIIPLLIGEMLDEKEKKLSVLQSKLPSYPKKRVTFDFPDNAKFKVIEDVVAELSKDHEVNTIDGAGVKHDDGWVLIRASNTSPLIRLTVETTTRERLEELYNKHSSLLKKYQKEFTKN
ncbi:MAG: hypothetical protein ACXAEU_10280 [Candidatus Hodarchaeales archaeon]|jgi:phosphomannomutase